MAAWCSPDGLRSGRLTPVPPRDTAFSGRAHGSRRRLPTTEQARKWQNFIVDIPAPPFSTDLTGASRGVGATAVVEGRLVVGDRPAGA